MQYGKAGFSTLDQTSEASIRRMRCVRLGFLFRSLAPKRGPAADRKTDSADRQRAYVNNGLRVVGEITKFDDHSPRV